MVCYLGWQTAGKLACPYCNNCTKSFYLKNGRKTCWFDCHRQFLPMDHPFRKNRDSFIKQRVEKSRPPRIWTGEELLATVLMFPKITDGPISRLEGFGCSHNWKKRSIFWDLPYWKDNILRHNLDVMHIEKNVFDNIFYTVMDVKGTRKNKDSPAARLEWFLWLFFRWFNFLFYFICFIMLTWFRYVMYSANRILVI